MKLRIALVTIPGVLTERKKALAVQKRVGFFWWQTLAYCDGIKQARYYANYTLKNKHSEELLKIVEYHSE